MLVSKDEELWKISKNIWLPFEESHFVVPLNLFHFHLCDYNAIDILKLYFGTHRSQRKSPMLTLPSKSQVDLPSNGYSN